VINIKEGDQFTPEYIAINPNSKIPAIVDHDTPDGEPLTVFESGAILVYLADKTNSPLLPTHYRDRSVVMQWLMFQMGGVGPMLGQANHFLKFAPEKVPYGIERYSTEARRIYGVLDARLAQEHYLAGDAYSIADIATYPWVNRHEFHQIELADFPNVQRWWQEIGARPAVQKGLNVGVV